MGQFSHFDEKGYPKMVDVSSKPDSLRIARATAVVKMNPKTLDAVENNEISKGNVFHVATVAGIMAAKKTSDLIPMCHPVRLTKVSIRYSTLRDKTGVKIEATAEAFDKTGVEIESIVAASIAAVTIIDMCKSYDKMIEIIYVRLEEKEGGRSGHFNREENALK